jgi:hypothetical protein
MAIGAGSAQAEPGAFWLVNGAKMPEGLLPFLGAEIEPLSDKKVHLVLLTTILKIKVEILCSEIELIEAHLLEPNGGSLGKALFKGCVILLNGVQNENCKPPGGHITTVLVKNLLLLHIPKGKTEPEAVIDFEPAAGTTFATLTLSELCPIGEKIPIGGKLVLKDCLSHLLVDQVIHLLEFNELSHLYTVSDTAEHAATIDGSINVFLTGKHAGLTWAGHPN